MLIKTKLTKNEYTKALLAQLISSAGGKIFIGTTLAYLLFQIVMEFIHPSDFPSSGLLTAIIVCVVAPFAVRNGIRKGYSNSPRISETIEYRFDNQYLTITGESFTGQLTWDKIHTVTQTKNWLFIWQSKRAASIIPKRDIPEGCIPQLREILNNHQVKNKL